MNERRIRLAQLTAVQGLVLFMVLAWVLIAMARTVTPFDASNAHDIDATKPAAVGSYVALAQAHGCWGEGDDAPAGVIPGHVVAIPAGGVAVTYGGHRLTDLALKQVLEGAANGLTVYAFCP